MISLRPIYAKLPKDGVVRDKLRKFNIAPEVDGKAKSVKELAIDLGFNVARRRLPRGMSGRLVQDAFADNFYCIEVNEAQSIEAQRWAVLHEIGHYYLHADRSDPLADAMYLDRSSSAFYVDKSEEREANEFAEAVLFGDGALAAASSLYGEDLNRLKRHFGVSEAALKIALAKI